MYYAMGVKMEDILKVLQETPYGFLATLDNGVPKVRPFGLMFEEAGKLYFCTNSTKEVYSQLINSPNVQFAVTSKDMITVRLSGEIVFTEEMDKKEKALNSSEMVKKGYQSAANPIFKVFFMEHGTATVADFSGKPPISIEF
jgi:uncharacterized pyridoxamine 5'-phosphate oxidase family protein